jgi:hypothetical protein
MKARKIVTLTVIAALVLLLAAGVGLVLAQGPPLGASVGTAFTYQGQLADAGSPAEGTYDFQFELHDHPASGSQVGDTLYEDDKEVNEGLFTVSLDFGPGVFTGEARYLEIGVRAGESSEDYTTLAPRQELTAAPYALHSLSTGALQGYPVSDSLPTTGQLLQWNGSAWEPATVAAANQPPVAVLQAERSVFAIGESTTLSLTLSYDPEGGPLTYAFDPTGSALGEPTSYGSTAVTTTEYSTPGDYLAAGWVKDGAGHFDVAWALVSAYGFWNTIVDSSGDVGYGASLAVVDGRPAIAYYGDSGLKYVRASNASGSAWTTTPITVTSTGNVGALALAVVDGRPAMAYYDGSPNYDLMYVRASDATGSSWSTTPITVTSSGDVGKYASLEVVDGRPAIAYYDGSPNYDLKYVRAGDAAGDTWGTPFTVDSDGYVGYCPSLEVVDGRPAIAYWAWASDYLLKYVRASDATGDTWGTPLTVHSSGAAVDCVSLALVDGRPAIAYYGGGDLKYVRASETTGDTWGTPLTVDSAGDVGLYASLAEVDGRPAIAHYDSTNGDLRFAILRRE